MEIERIEYEGGIKIYLKGHVYPQKGLPTEQAVFAVNIAKKLLSFKFRDAVYTALQPHLLKPEYMTPFAREIKRMFPSKLGTVIAHIFEYDSSYRLRTQDLANETSKEALLRNPFKEIRRLLAINKRRDYEEVHLKFKRFGYVLMALLFLPQFRRKFRELDFDKLKPDTADFYWTNIRTDYKSRA